MRDNLVNWVKLRAPFLLEEKMPVWFTVIVGLLAGILTYFATPMLNRQFELDTVRSAQISKTIDGLNVQIIALSKNMRKLTSSLTNDPASSPKIREECYDLVTEMQWRLVDLRVVLSNREDLDAVDKLSGAIRGVQDALDISVDKASEPKLLLSMKALGEATEDVLNRLYKRASLKQ